MAGQDSKAWRGRGLEHRPGGKAHLATEKGVGTHPTLVTRKRGKMYEDAGKFIDLAAEN